MQAKPGDEIVVSGTCQENVVIPSAVHDVTLRGQSNAAIIGADPKKPVLLILGREIRVRSLRLAQGRNGISILRGATAQVDGVIIEDVGRDRIPGSGLGMNIGQHAFASVTNSTIRNNWNVGILVHENSGARIGFVDVATIAGANTIMNNGVGILVSAAAQARVVGTTIAHNKSDGIRVEEGSHLEFAGNTIEDNGGDGVLVTGNSGAVVAIGQNTVTPNKTGAGVKNAGFGISCSLGGYVAGMLGELAGMKGSTNIVKGCVDDLAR